MVMNFLHRCAASSYPLQCVCIRVNESSLISPFLCASPPRCSPGMESATCSTLPRRGRRSAPPWREGRETAWRSCWTSSRTSTCRCGGTQVGMTTSSPHPVLLTSSSLHPKSHHLLPNCPPLLKKEPKSSRFKPPKLSECINITASKWIWDHDENQIKY